MDAKQEYQVQVEAQLKSWCAEVEKMLAEANRVQNVTMIARLHTLIDEQSAAQQQLQALKQADAESWPARKAALDETLAELLDDLNRVRETAIQSIGWAEGLAQEDHIKSIGWAEGIAEEDQVKSIGWAEGITKEDHVKSIGWAEGYKKKK
jgi:hypothetical protein